MTADERKTDPTSRPSPTASTCDIWHPRHVFPNDRFPPQWWELGGALDDCSETERGFAGKQQRIVEIRRPQGGSRE